MRRRNNLVITGLDPFLPQGKKYENSKMTAELLVNSRLATNVKVKEARRLRRARSDGSTVPLLIRLGCSADKWTIMKNCFKLRGTKIRVHKDLPVKLRMVRVPFIPAFHVYRRREKHVKWEGKRLVVEGKALSSEKVAVAAAEFFKERARRKAEERRSDSPHTQTLPENI
jgi:hypothetical protein